MVNQVKRHTTIAISQQNKDALDSIKHPGQSYDGAIQELLNFWKEKGSEYLTPRKEQGVPVG